MSNLLRRRSSAALSRRAYPVVRVYMVASGFSTPLPPLRPKSQFNEMCSASVTTLGTPVAEGDAAEAAQKATQCETAAWLHGVLEWFELPGFVGSVRDPLQALSCG